MSNYEVSNDASAPRRIQRGQWAEWPGALDYRSAWLSDMLVERVIWGQPAAALQQIGQAQGKPAGPGSVWFRFWLPKDGQIVEKYFDRLGACLGIQADVCMPLVMVGEVCWTADLLLDIWINAEGRVTVRNEAAFDRAAAEGLLSADEASYAEQHLRRLTGAIAQGRFPPPLVRNWQIDLERLSETLSADEGL